jgi:hypothetical protein
MAGIAVNSSFVLLSKLIASRQERASKTAINHIRKTLAARVSDSANFEPTACDNASASPIYHLEFQLDVIN